MKKMKFLLLMMCLLFVKISVSAEVPITVSVDGEQVVFDVQPQLIGGRTMVPLRAIFEALGATVLWDDTTQTVTAYNEAYLVKATIGQTTMTVNGESKQTDIAPMIVDGRTLVPARFVAEAFDCDVEWDGDKKAVHITTKPIDYHALESDISPNTASDDCYPGTDIPTYTGITGEKPIKQDKLNDGSPIYVYKYTGAEDIGDYLKKLGEEGWRILEEDDVSTIDRYEGSYIRGEDMMLFIIFFEYNEIWINYSKM